MGDGAAFGPGGGIGVGSTTKMRGVRWGAASRIVWAWIFGIPAAAAVAAVFSWILSQLGLW